MKGHRGTKSDRLPPAVGPTTRRWDATGTSLSRAAMDALVRDLLSDCGAASRAYASSVLGSLAGAPAHR